MPTRRLVLIVGTLLAATVIVAQQHSYTQEDINAGAKLYESNCGSCHGENGDKITGIDFSKSTFKTARTDDDVIRIIRNGVPNTGMPPSPLSEVQANTIVAFVRSMPGGTRALNAPATASLTGDAARGKTLFEGKGNCASCHAINGAGGTSGPDLVATGGRGGRGAAAGAPPAAGAPAAAGGRGGRGGAPGGAGAAVGGGRGGGQGGQGARGGGGAPAAGGPPAGGGGRGGAAPPNPQQLERSIVDPSAEMAPQYRVYQVVTKANVTAKGTLLNQDTFSIQLRDTNDKLMSFWKSDLKEYGFMPSPMPSYRGTLTPQEIADVVSYLVSLRSN